MNSELVGLCLNPPQEEDFSLEQEETWQKQEAKARWGDSHIIQLFEKGVSGTCIQGRCWSMKFIEARNVV
jgi:hypothetical protein